MNFRSTVAGIALFGLLSMNPTIVWSQQATAPTVTAQAFIDNPNTLLSGYPDGTGLQAAVQALVTDAASSGQLAGVMNAVRAEITRPGANPDVIMALFNGSNSAAAALVENNQAAAAAIRQVLADRAVVAATEFERQRLASNGTETSTEVATSAISPGQGAAAIGGAGSTPGTGAGGTGAGGASGPGTASGAGTFTGAQGGGGASFTRTSSSCVINVSTDTRC